MGILFFAFAPSASAVEDGRSPYARGFVPINLGPRWERDLHDRNTFRGGVVDVGGGIGLEDRGFARMQAKT